MTLGIPITDESIDDPPAERCCFCRSVTSTWTALPERLPGDQVACCASCAKNATAAHVPHKVEWCEREAIAMGPLAGFQVKFARDREAFAKRWPGYARAYIRLRNRVARLIYGELGHGDGADDIDGDILDRTIEAMDELRRASGIARGFHISTVVREVLGR